MAASIGAMYKTKTVIVVGAGASVEYGMPDGLGLRDYIRRALDIRFATFGDPAGPPEYGTAEAIEALSRKQKSFTQVL